MRRMHSGRIFFERKSALREGNRQSRVCRGAQCAPVPVFRVGNLPGKARQWFGLRANKVCPDSGGKRVA